MPEEAKRKFGKKDQTHKNNLLKLVKALLSLAKGELTLEDSQLVAAVKVEWVSEKTLRVNGEYKKKTRTGKEQFKRGTTKQALWQLVEKTDNALELPQRQQENSLSNTEKRQAEVVQDAIYYLEDLAVLKDERPENTKNTKYWIFSLTLKHKDASIEENLGVIKQKLGLETSPATQETEFLEKPGFCLDWQDCCRQMLPTALSANPLLSGDGVMLNIEDIVPLELVERKQRPQLQKDFSPEHFQVEASSESEVPVSHDQFFEQVLAKRNSDKSQGRKIAIIGEPGAGKTTFLQEIAHWIYPEQGLPIFLRLADLQEKSLEEYLLNDWLKNATGKRHIPDEIQDDFVKQFNADRVWLLLDGIDEMAVSGNLLSSIDKHLKGWVDKARIVLTCRLNVWDADKNALYGFDTYRTKQLSYPEMVREFISHFFSKFGEVTKGKKLIEKLEQSPQRIRDLIKNPLRLTLLCRTWKRRQGKLPQTKAELYKGFVETFYDWKDKPEILPEKRQLLNRALGELAKRAIDAENTKFRLRETFIREELDKFDKCLFSLACDVGWINKVGVAAENPDEPVYAFFHPTFQEYFAALAVDDWHEFQNHNNDNPNPFQKYNHKDCVYRIFERQWKEVILLWLGRPYKEVAKEEKEEFIKALVEFRDGYGEFYGYRAYFLAAAGIAEFGSYDYAEQIIKILVGLGFGYCTFANQPVKFLEPMAQAAKAVLPETDRTKVLAALVQLIQNSQDEVIRMQAAESLGEIDQDNPTAIAALVQLIQNSHNEVTRSQAAQSLGKIAKNNSTAIAALIQLIENCQNEFTCSHAAFSLGQIAKNNSSVIETLVKLIDNCENEVIHKLAALSLEYIENDNPSAIAALIKLIHKFQDESTRRQATGSLGRIAKDNPIAIQALVELLQNSQDEFTRRLAAAGLSRIRQDNPTVIKALVDLIHNCEHESLRRQAAFSLRWIGKDNPTVIKALVELIHKSQDESTRWQAAESLGEIAKDNPIAITALVELIQNSQDEHIRRLTAESLGKIDKDNPIAIEALVELIQNSQNEDICWRTARILGEIAKDNPIAIEALVKLIQNSQNEFTRWQAADSLGKIDKNNPIAIEALVELIQNSQDESTRKEAVSSLKKLLSELQVQKMVEVVTTLKNYLSDETAEHDFKRYRDCYEVIWHCAQNMTYPTFYQAWHQQEGEGNTNTPSSQNLNPANLPQRLQSAIANDPQLSQTIHLICIDTSKFINPDNPAAKIYTEMVKGGCPKCEDGTPKTMAELQTYWDLLESDKRVALVFYEGKGSTSQGLSQAFLNNINKFDGAICVISDEPKDDIPVKFFTSSQAIQDLVQWLRDI